MSSRVELQLPTPTTALEASSKLLLFYRLIVAVAKDLRQEFHPYFFSVYRLLVPLAESRQPDVIEWTFQTLAYLFKFLWRPLVASSLDEVFEALLPFLSASKPIYLNNFAAQSFAFLARKVKEPTRLVKLIVRHARKFPSVGRSQIIAKADAFIREISFSERMCHLIFSSRGSKDAGGWFLKSSKASPGISTAVQRQFLKRSLTA